MKALKQIPLALLLLLPFPLCVYAFTYQSSQHFSLNIPEGWEEIPREQLNTLSEKGISLTGKKVTYEAGFRITGGTGLPNILIPIIPQYEGGRELPSDLLDKWEKQYANGEAEQNWKSLLHSYSISNLSLDRPYINKQKKRIVVKGQARFSDQDISFLAAIVVGKYAVVMVTLSFLDSDYSTYAGLFEGILNSVKMKEPVSNRRDLMPKIVASLLLGLIISAFWGLKKMIEKFTGRSRFKNRGEYEAWKEKQIQASKQSSVSSSTANEQQKEKVQSFMADNTKQDSEPAEGTAVSDEPVEAEKSHVQAPPMGIQGVAAMHQKAKIKRIIAREGLILITLGLCLTIFAILSTHKINKKHNYMIDAVVYELYMDHGPLSPAIGQPLDWHATGIFITFPKGTPLEFVQKIEERDYVHLGKVRLLIPTDDYLKYSAEAHYDSQGDKINLNNHYDSLANIVIFLYPIYWIIRFSVWAFKTLRIKP